MSNHDYDGCHDQACDLCAAYAAGKDKARWELGQPDAVLICPAYLANTRGALRLCISPQPAIRPSGTPIWKLASKASRCAIVVLASISGASTDKPSLTPGS